MGKLGLFCKGASDANVVHKTSKFKLVNIWVVLNIGVFNFFSGFKILHLWADITVFLLSTRYDQQVKFQYIKRMFPQVTYNVKPQRLGNGGSQTLGRRRCD
jgi:hypothetical protein